MREEYDIKNLNPRKNPYSKRLKKQITININVDTIDYFVKQSEQTGIPWHSDSWIVFRHHRVQQSACSRRHFEPFNPF